MPAEEDELVEDFGVHIGRAMGWPPMAGRAAALLMLSEKPLTLAQLQEGLDASKGSVSETTRLLIVNGTVERFKEPGSRQFVYRWRDDAWIGCLQHQLGQTAELLKLAERGHERGASFDTAQRARLTDMRDYYRFMVRGLEDLLAAYTKQQQGK
ncbi:hypothetical protein ATK30_0034 [Amycolatopsis echigonensis]|uniref:DNA-binding transcriptional regulator GbsR (MarR family) n=1 Tax=Amycolatopsis echigonensis TaxID=2576905 RepID=A0A2N3X1G4_9PSEU|nr:hypothetical protein [Amycolatopsis niigatensis]PKV99962.1 hypothetical protein ATK30_0034 [Amycolatopsis niigatensis]